MKQIPVKADIEAQETFKIEVLEPLVEQAQAGKIALFFVDAAHFVMLPFLSYLYSLTVRFIKAASGRQRFSVLGALNAITKEVVTITDHGYINALSVRELLQKLHDLFRHLPIVVIMDNARYQRCAKVMEQAQALGIDLLFLPPYSPNLNLLERWWKFTKKKCLYHRYYETFCQFKDAIDDCLDKVTSTFSGQVKTLLNPKFQIFKQSASVTA